MKPLALLPALIVLSPSCKGVDCTNQPTTFWRSVETAIRNRDANGVGVACYEIPGAAPQSYDTGHGGSATADPCAPSPSDGACVLCLKSKCCAEAGEPGAVFDCGTANCAAACGGA